MNLSSRMRTWGRGIFHQREVDAQVSEELRFHIESYAEDLMCAGLSREEALRRARAELGSAMAVRENARQAWGTRWLDELRGDLRYGLRVLRKNFGLTAIAVTSLGIGIGANIAIFSLTNTLLLDAMPVPHPEQLRLLEWQAQHQSGYKNLPMGDLYGSVQFTKTGVATGTEFSWDEYEALRQNRAVFHGLAAYYHDGGAALVAGNDLQHGTLEYVSPSFFEVLGIRAAVGRTILPSDDASGGAPVVVLSDWIWRDMYGRSPAVIGSTIDVNRIPLTIVGVAPSGFHGADVDNDPALYVPFTMQPQLSPDQWDRGKSRLSNGNTWWVRILGRISPQVTNAQAAVALDGIFRQTAKATLPHPQRVDTESVHLGVIAGARGDARRTDEEFVPVALGMSVLAGFVLVLACVNLANLLLARTMARRRELSVRMAMGAGRGRLARQLLLESLLLAMLGGGAGIALAFAGRNLIPQFLEHQHPAFDWRVYAFAAGLSLLTCLLFGGIPAWRATRVDIQRGLQDGGRSTADRSHLRLGRGLVIMQACLSMVLLIGTGLFVRTVRNLLHVDLGFDPHHVLLFEITLPARPYAKPEERAAAFRQIEQRLASMPGVLSATFSGEPLISGGPSTTDFDPTGEPSGRNTAWRNVVGDHFFRTMGIPLLAGRDFGLEDTAQSRPVAIVNEKLAQRFFPGRDPLGLTFNSPPIRIVGIAGNTKFSDLRQTPPPTFYLPASQNGGWNQVTFELRTSGSPLALADAARIAVHGFDPQLPVAKIRTQEEQIDESIRDERLFEFLTAAFGLLALALASIGIYGIMAYAVARRTNEIGIRMALGAQPGRVLRSILGEASGMVALGAVVGLGGALAMGRLVANLLFGLKAWDPVVFGGSAALLILVALAASWIPARRAARVDPIQALRHE
ncbi:MAG: ABC transporter permease [Acidobacteriaceae bacterium]